MKMEIKFSIVIYEPAIDPGGYIHDTVITACCEEQAKKLAIYEAERKYPTNSGFKIASCIPVNLFNSL